MGLYTFILYLLVFGEILCAQEVTDRDFDKLSLGSGAGLVTDLLLWVSSSLGALKLVFTLFCWGSFFYFTAVTVYLYFRLREEFSTHSTQKNDKKPEM